jgi:tRNA (cmo5U34)-methyltransferase
MSTEANPQPPAWNEEDSHAFIDLGRYAVPEREWQLTAFCDLIAPADGPCTVAELCCGEGLLAEALLERYPHATVIGYDGSPAMLAGASARLQRFGPRFLARQFDLADRSWRSEVGPVQAVVSSLAIHHLDDSGKQLLFRDIFAMLAGGGTFTIADVVAPASPRAVAIAADAWDAAVRRRALELDGNLHGFTLFEHERWNMYRYPDPDDGIDKPSRLFDQLCWLAAAGFAEVDVYWMQAGHALFGGRKLA